jgi:hypothetical protein
MAIIVNLIKQYQAWIYGICALVAFWYLRVAIISRRERREAMFNLERETALNRTYGAWAVAALLVIVMGGVYLLSTVVSDAVQPLVEALNQTPTPQLAAAPGEPTFTPTLPVSDLPTPTVTPTKAPTTRPRPTPRQQPTPDAMPTATRPRVQAPRCPDPRAVISSPGLQAEVSGFTPIIGTAAHENFQFYKLEYGVGENPGAWSYFDGGERPVQGGQLGTLNASALAPGQYSIRIVVVDTSGNFPAPCQTTIVIR